MAKNIFNFGLGTVGGNKSLQNKLFRKHIYCNFDSFRVRMVKKCPRFDSNKVRCEFNTIPVKMASQKACKYQTFNRIKIFPKPQSSINFATAMSNTLRSSHFVLPLRVFSFCVIRK